MEQPRNIYPDKQKAFSKEQQRLERDTTISPANKNAIRNFQNHLFSTGSGFLRVSKLTGQLRRICNVINKDLTNLATSDIHSFLASLAQQSALALGQIKKRKLTGSQAL